MERFDGVDLSPYTRVVWPADPTNPIACLEDRQVPTVHTYGLVYLYFARNSSPSG